MEKKAASGVWGWVKKLPAVKAFEGMEKDAQTISISEVVLTLPAVKAFEGMENDIFFVPHNIKAVVLPAVKAFEGMENSSQLQHLER